MSRLGFPMVDADQHFYETDDCFTRHLPQRFLEAGRAVHIVRKADKPQGRVFIGDEKVAFFGANPCDATGRPGALLEYFASGGQTGKGLFHGGLMTADDFPETRSRKARLDWFDAEGVQAAVMLPTLAVGVEYQLSRDPEALHAGLAAFNRWLEEDWGYGNDGRIFGVPLLSLIDVAWAVEELERVIDGGARIVHLRAGPVAGRRSPADPLHDPFWARCQEAGVAVAFHLGNSGEVDYYASLWGENPNAPQHRFTPFQRVTSFGERAIHDTMLALVTHNLFGRFPNLTVLSIEFGSEWVAPLLKKMDRAARMCGPDDWPYGTVKERPREVFKRHVKVAPYTEDDIVGLVRLLGADSVLGGSDWPHPEGVSHPQGFAERLFGELTDDELRKVMRDNTATILGVA